MNPAAARSRRLEVEPREFDFRRPGEETDVRVRAVFADGSAADVAAFCEFRVKDESVAEVSDRGRVTAVRPGDTAVIVAYRGSVAAMRVYVRVARPESAKGVAKMVSTTPFAEPQGVPPDSGRATLIDREVVRQAPPPQHRALRPVLRRRIPPPGHDRRDRQPADARARSAPSSPTAEPTSAPGRSTSCSPTRGTPPSGRSKFCDITGCNVDAMDGPPELRPKRAQMWHDWFRARFAANMPYDQIARGVLLRHQPRRRGRAGLDRPRGRARPLGPRRVRRAATPTGRRSTCSGGGSTTATFFPIEPMAELTVGGVPGRPDRMCPVPQAPVRPLDPGRLPRLRQHLRRRRSSTARRS